MTNQSASGDIRKGVARRAMHPVGMDESLQYLDKRAKRTHRSFSDDKKSFHFRGLRAHRTIGGNKLILHILIGSGRSISLSLPVCVCLGGIATGSCALVVARRRLRHRCDDVHLGWWRRSARGRGARFVVDDLVAFAAGRGEAAGHGPDCGRIVSTGGGKGGERETCR